MRIILTAALLVAGLAAGACSGDDNGEGITIAAGFFPLAEVAREVAGSRATVVSLTPAGAEPHDLELTSRQVDQARRADVLLYLGHGFQPAVEELAGQTEGEAIDLLAGLPVVDDDPHVWLDPALMNRITTRVAQALREADPDGKAAYDLAEAKFRDRLVALDTRYRRGLADCDRNVVLVSHASFLYLTSRYDLEQEPIAGASPEAEPSPARLAELVELVREAGVTTIFSEPLAPGGAAETLARETGVRTADLDPIEGLTSGSGADRRSYVALMDDNLDVLRTGLGCR
jgi:zinc transport system substrate-binding protein